MTSRKNRILSITTALAVSLVVAPAAVLVGSASATPSSATASDHWHHTGHAGSRHDVPQIIGHRGAPGYRPEHTLAGYKLAIDMGADYIEPDLVPTKDGVLVARHENAITDTTDVANHPEFADRRTTKTIDGVQVTGWFTEDFTLAELKTLRAKERLPQLRTGNTRYDGRYEIPTFAEVLKLVRDEGKRLNRTIGVAPETKHPTYFDSIGLSPEEPMLADLRAARLDRPNAKVLIQSFEISNLRELSRRTHLPLEQLIAGSGAPYDQVVAGTGVTYTDMTKPAALRQIARYADWIGPDKFRVIPKDSTGAAAPATSLVADAHAVGLKVVIYTLRDENQFMATTFQRPGGPNAFGDIFAEVAAFLDAGVDALFADFPDSAVAARDFWLAEQD